MNKNLLRLGAVLLLSCAGAAPAAAQLPAAAPGKAVTGHTHLFVSDRERHREIWMELGAKARMSGNFEVLMLPGMFILLAERSPTVPSVESSAHHLGFTVNSFGEYRDKLQALELEVLAEDEERGRLVFDLPNGARIELLEDKGQEGAIAFHHYHIAGEDPGALRDWYVKVFGAQESERGGAPSAVVPGGRVDFMEAPEGGVSGSSGSAIDHIGFEVADMEVFARRMEELGIEFSYPPTEADAIGLTIAFIRDPAGTSIEITEGLAGIR